MSWNITVGVLKGADISALPISPETVSFDEASESFEPHAASLGDDVVLLDMVGESMEAALALGVQYFQVIFGGTADVYVIEAVGEINRRRIHSAGEVEEVGDPLPQEALLEQHPFPEDGHFAVLEALLQKPFSELYEAQFHPLTL